jgi:peroxiredoxin
MAITTKADAERWVAEGMLAQVSCPNRPPDTARGPTHFGVRRTKLDRRSRRWTWRAVAMAVVGLSVGVLFEPSARAEPPGAPMGAVTRLGGKLGWGQPFTERAQAAADRRPMAPTLNVVDAAGDRIDLGPLQGQVVLINFWATWCVPCKVEIPWFVDFQTRYRSQGFTVVGISQDKNGWADVLPFTKPLKMNYRLALATDRLLSAYGGVDVLPVTFLIDRRGRVAFKYIGISAKVDYEKSIAQLLAER